MALQLLKQKPNQLMESELSTNTPRKHLWNIQGLEFHKQVSKMQNQSGQHVIALRLGVVQLVLVHLGQLQEHLNPKNQITESFLELVWAELFKTSVKVVEIQKVLLGMRICYCRLYISFQMQLLLMELNGAQLTLLNYQERQLQPFKQEMDWIVSLSALGRSKLLMEL